MVNLVIFRDGGEIIIACVLKEEIKTSMIKCGKTRGQRCPSKLTEGLVLQEGFRRRPFTEQRGRTPPRMGPSPGAWSPSGTFLKTRGGQPELLLGSFHRNHFRDRPKVLQRVPKT